MTWSASLVVIKRSGDDGQRYVLDDRHWCTIGSHPECDIIIHSKGVAKLHALVRITEYSSASASVFGLDPELPTVVPGRKAALYKDDGVSLEVGDKFYVGERAFRFEFTQMDQGRVLSETTNQIPRSNLSSVGGDAQSNTTGSPGRRQDRRRRRSSLVVKDTFEEFVVAAKTQSLLTAHRLSLPAERVITEFFKEDALPLKVPKKSFESKHHGKLHPTKFNKASTPVRQTNDSQMSSRNHFEISSDKTRSPRTDFGKSLPGIQVPESNSYSNESALGTVALESRSPATDFGKSPPDILASGLNSSKNESALATAPLEIKSPGKYFGKSPPGIQAPEFNSTTNENATATVSEIVDIQPQVHLETEYPAKSSFSLPAVARTTKTPRPSAIPSTLHKPTFASAARSKPNVGKSSHFLAKRSSRMLMQVDPSNLPFVANEKTHHELPLLAEEATVEPKSIDTQRICTPKRLATSLSRTELRQPKRARNEGLSRTAPRATKLRTLSNAHIQAMSVHDALASPRRLSRLPAPDKAELNGSRLFTPLRGQTSTMPLRSPVTRNTFAGMLEETQAPTTNPVPFNMPQERCEHSTTDPSKTSVGQKSLDLPSTLSRFETEPVSGVEAGLVSSTISAASRSVPTSASQTVVCATKPGIERGPEQVRKQNLNPIQKQTSLKLVDEGSKPIPNLENASLGQAGATTAVPEQYVVATQVSLPASDDFIGSEESSSNIELLYATMKFPPAKKELSSVWQPLRPRLPVTDSHVRVLRKRPITPPKQILRKREPAVSSALHIRRRSGISKQSKNPRLLSGHTPMSQKTVLFADALGADIELASGPHYSPQVKRCLREPLQVVPEEEVEDIQRPLFGGDTVNDRSPTQIAESPQNKVDEQLDGSISEKSARSLFKDNLPQPSPSPSITAAQRRNIVDSAESIAHALGPPPSTGLARLGLFFYPIRPRLPMLMGPSPRKLIEGPRHQPDSPRNRDGTLHDAMETRAGASPDRNSGTPRRSSFSSLSGFASAVGLIKRLSSSSIINAKDETQENVGTIETPCPDSETEQDKCCSENISKEQESETSLTSVKSVGHSGSEENLPSFNSDDCALSDNTEFETPIREVPRRQSLIGRAFSAAIAVATTPVNAVFGSRSRSKSEERPGAFRTSELALEFTKQPRDVPVPRDHTAVDNSSTTMKLAAEIRSELTDSDIVETARASNLSGAALGDFENDGSKQVNESHSATLCHQDKLQTGNFEEWTVKELKEYLSGLGKPHAGLRKADLVELAQSSITNAAETLKVASDILSTPSAKFCPSPSGVCTKSELQSSTVRSLRKELELLGLSTTGRKSELVERMETLCSERRKESHEKPNDHRPAPPCLQIQFDEAGGKMSSKHATGEPNYLDKDTLDELTFMTVRELRERLRAQGLATDGRKADLIRRLHGSEAMDDPEECLSDDSEDVQNFERQTLIPGTVACSATCPALASCTEDDLRLRTVVELRAALKKRNLSTAGKKPELVSRLARAPEEMTSETHMVAKSNSGALQPSRKSTSEPDPRKMNTKEIRQFLLERSFCGVGTKAVLLRRAICFVSGERQTRNSVNLSLCARCQREKTCEAALR
jgi:SAP domain